MDQGQASVQRGFRQLLIQSRQRESQFLGAIQIAGIVRRELVLAGNQHNAARRRRLRSDLDRLSAYCFDFVQGQCRVS